MLTNVVRLVFLCMMLFSSQHLLANYECQATIENQRISYIMQQNYLGPNEPIYLGSFDIKADEFFAKDVPFKNVGKAFSFPKRVSFTAPYPKGLRDLPAYFILLALDRKPIKIKVDEYTLGVFQNGTLQVGVDNKHKIEALLSAEKWQVQLFSKENHFLYSTDVTLPADAVGLRAAYKKLQTQLIQMSRDPEKLCTFVPQEDPNAIIAL